MGSCRMCVCLALAGCVLEASAQPGLNPAANAYLPWGPADLGESPFGPYGTITNTRRHHWLGPMIRVPESRQPWWEPLLSRPELTVQRPPAAGPAFKFSYSRPRVQPEKLIAFGRLGVLRWNSAVGDCFSDSGCQLNLGFRRNGLPKLQGTVYMGIYYVF